MSKFSDYKFQIKRLEKNISKLPKKDQAYVTKAYHLAEKYHKGQKRHTGSPYFIHCARITSNLYEKLKIEKKEVLAAALLHDAVEDTSLTLGQIEKQFGKKTSRMVANLTRNHEGDTEENKYIRKFKKNAALMKKDKYTRTIKALDLLDNVISWAFIPNYHATRKKFPRWFKEAETMYIPLAKTVDEKIVKEIKKALREVKRNT